jgi:translation initiation factor IF-2
VPRPLPPAAGAGVTEEQVRAKVKRMKREGHGPGEAPVHAAVRAGGAPAQPAAQLAELVRAMAQAQQVVRALSGRAPGAPPPAAPPAASAPPASPPAARPPPPAAQQFNQLPAHSLLHQRKQLAGATPVRPAPPQQQPRAPPAHKVDSSDDDDEDGDKGRRSSSRSSSSGSSSGGGRGRPHAAVAEACSGQGRPQHAGRAPQAPAPPRPPHPQQQSQQHPQQHRQAPPPARQQLPPAAHPQPQLPLFASMPPYRPGQKRRKTASPAAPKRTLGTDGRRSRQEVDELRKAVVQVLREAPGQQVRQALGTEMKRHAR